MRFIFLSWTHVTVLTYTFVCLFVCLFVVSLCVCVCVCVFADLKVFGCMRFVYSFFTLVPYYRIRLADERFALLL